MRKSAFAGLLLCVLTFLALTPSASAESIALFEQKPSLDVNIEIATEVISSVGKVDDSESSKEKKPKAEKHTVKRGESLSKIAKSYDVSWKKLFYKNTDIDDPDNIKPGDVLVIPKPDEKLAKRKIPVNKPKVTPAKKSSANSVTTRPIRYYSSAGNTYTAGYCTWYVKNRRPNLPNGLGNAYEWLGNARALGMSTGSKPRVGAAGQRGNHVVFVENVHSDGTVTISEMNHVGWNITNTRRLPANYFTYIY